MLNHSIANLVLLVCKDFIFSRYLIIVLNIRCENVCLDEHSSQLECMPIICEYTFLQLLSDDDGEMLLVMYRLSLSKLKESSVFLFCFKSVVYFTNQRLFNHYATVVTIVRIQQGQ